MCVFLYIHILYINTEKYAGGTSHKYEILKWYKGWYGEWVSPRHPTGGLGERREGGVKKRGHRPSYLVANILKTPWPNSMEIGGLLQYYMLNTVINFLFKNSIALLRHLAKTQLLCDAQIYIILYSVNKR